MYLKRFHIIFILVLFGIGNAQAQEMKTEFGINFRVNSTSIDSAYLDNAHRLKQITGFLQNIRKDSTLSIVELTLCGAASPEGSAKINRKLANERMAALEMLVRKEIGIPDSIIKRNDSYIPWDSLKSQIKASNMKRKEEVLAILENEGQLVDFRNSGVLIDNRIAKLMQQDNGRLWEQMKKQFFKDMRNASTIFITYKRIQPAVEKPVVIPDTISIEPEPVKEVVEVLPDTTTAEDTIITEVERWIHQIHIKTNALGWGLGIANVATEVDLSNHWSFTLPIYYSAWDYFTSTIKFRTFAIQPELRYWLSENNNGFFAGLHFGMAYYNIAVNGDYRYQDQGRETPALGGGISVGYRMPISKDNRWRIEFSLGAGAYSLHYDKFHNTPDTKDGLLLESVKQTYWGIDQAAVSFSYTFDLNKKGGKR